MSEQSVLATDFYDATKGERARLVKALRGYGNFPHRDIADDFLNAAAMLERDGETLNRFVQTALDSHQSHKGTSNGR